MNEQDLTDLIEAIEDIAQHSLDDEDESQNLWVNVLLALMELRAWRSLFPDTQPDPRVQQ